ncbi:MAG TPA: aspartate aminotransferase family protein [Cycloclasticus sp.]|jgi:acetylornithine aminotransferase|nr:aspartate aminotransferase family protein [Cycloclasticus sp.]HIL91715.1 aspartate aminotransferase family protein [Cycloclasticus sp.]
MKQHIMPTYASLPVRFIKGEGAWLWDDKGEKYLDALSGIAVCGLGHAHPEIADAISKQANTLLHTSNLYAIDNQEQLANTLCELTGMNDVFFGNSGAEANEAAIKIARRFAHSKNIENPVIVTMNNSFHGRTLATLTATGNPKVKEGFAPLPEGFCHIPYNDIPALETLASRENTIVAVMVEPIQGESGIRIPDADYLNKLRELCDQNDWLLILDEIQTGIGRTGSFLASQQNNIKADVVTLAKALGNGVPIGACLTAGKATGLLTAGSHGSTFGGNPLACAAALTVINIIQRDHLADRAIELGERIRASFQHALSGCKHVVEIRQKGLMIGIELTTPCTELASKALEQHLLINVAGGNTVRLLPPLTISNKEADKITQLVSDLIIAH